MGDKQSKILVLPGNDWHIMTTSADGSSLDNAILERPDGRFFHITMVEAEVGGRKFWKPIIIEHGDGNTIGDIVIILRKNPYTHRWMVQVESEDLYVTETFTQKVWRTFRSSLDNLKQSIGRRVVAQTGHVYSNPARIGGKPIATHYVILGWGGQVADSMMDIFEYIRSTDAMGLATLIKALQHMPDKPAKEILGQIRKPAEDQE